LQLQLQLPPLPQITTNYHKYIYTYITYQRDNCYLLKKSYSQNWF
jgi:hypothetical protein